MDNLILTIELVPLTSWYTNVRSNVTTSQWNKIRKLSYLKADNKCEICFDNGINQGYRHKVECHEIWDYDDLNKIQKLIGLISLCPMCHKVKHIGLSESRGEYFKCLKHICKVNNINENVANKYVDQCYKIFDLRSQYKWQLDISYLDSIL